VAEPTKTPEAEMRKLGYQVSYMISAGSRHYSAFIFEIRKRSKTFS
jgi:hypothetical protein